MCVIQKTEKDCISKNTLDVCEAFCVVRWSQSRAVCRLGQQLDVQFIASLGLFWAVIPNCYAHAQP